MAKKAKRKTGSNAIAPASYDVGRKSHTISSRKIENGYIVNEHGHNQGKHFDRETYVAKEPKMPSIKAMEKKLGNKKI